MDLRAMLDDGASSGGLQKASLKEIAAAKIAALVVTGLFKVGDALPGERELAAAFGVSRDTIRGAILMLSVRGILSVAQGTRTTVASAEVGDMAVQAARHRDIAGYTLDDVHAARLVIEAEVAKAAARRVDADLLAQLEASLAAQEDAVEDPLRFLICDREFHLAIYRAGGNAALADMAGDLYSYLIDARRRAVSRPGSIVQSIADHRAILAGLAAGDPQATAGAFRVHETRIYDTTRASMAAG